MKLYYLFLIALLITLNQSCKQETAKEENATETIDSSTSLFTENGKDWQMGGNASWSFEEGVIIGRLDTGAGFLMTKQPYQDFVLNLEFNPDSTINSGIFGRCQEVAISPLTCYELNIWDLHPNQDFRTGAIVTKAKPLAYVETLGKWNNYKVKCEGTHIEAWVNDIKTTDIQDSTLAKGFIAIQAAGTGTIKFRNVQLELLGNE